MTQTHSFTLELSTCAEPAQMEAWLAAAEPRAEATYASGVEPPRDAPGFRLARRWAEAGEVALVSARDPHDSRRTLWKMQRTGVGVPGEGADLVESSGAGRAKPSLAGASGARSAASGSAAAGVKMVSPQVRDRADRLLDLLHDAAQAASKKGRRRFACPSLTELSDSLQLGRGERGRQRVRHALALLAREGRITIETVGPRGRTHRMVEVK